MAKAFQHWINQPQLQPQTPYTPGSPAKRNDSVCSTSENDPSLSLPPSRNPKTGVRNAHTQLYGSPCCADNVSFDRSRSNTMSAPNQPISDDDILMVTVRLTSDFRRSSIEGCEDLPDRPSPRGFTRRLSTRWHGSVDEEKYQAVKMPRREYRRHFKRDRDGTYIGTEPERQWSEDDIARKFGGYQDLSLKSILFSGGQHE